MYPISTQEDAATVGSLVVPRQLEYSTLKTHEDRPIL